MLFTHVQRLAAGHEQLEPGAIVQQLRSRGRRGGDLLEVVEQQQQMLFTQSPAEFVEQGLVAHLVQSDRACDGSEHRRAIADGGKVDEDDAVLEPVGVIGSRPEHALRQARRLSKSLSGKERPYRYKSLGEGATLGRDKGIAS